LIQEKTKISIPKKKSLEIGKKSIFQKFPSLLARRMRKSYTRPDLKSTDGEANGKKGNFYHNFRGVGELKFLQNKQNKLIRMLVRA
jgi:hypothetical protein